MKKRFLFAALCLAGVVWVFGTGSANADHFRAGYGSYYGGSGYGSCYGGVGFAPIAPAYDCGYGGYAGGYRGFDRHHHHHAAPYYPSRGHRGRGYGTNINVISPGLNLGLGY